MGPGREKEKLSFIWTKELSLSTTLILSSLSSAGPAATATAAPPSPDHHRRTEKPDLQEVGVGFEHFGFSIYASGLELPNMGWFWVFLLMQLHILIPYYVMLMIDGPIDALMRIEWV